MKQQKRKIWRVSILAFAVAAIVVPAAQAKTLNQSGGTYSGQSRYTLEVRSESMKRLPAQSASSSPYVEVRTEALNRLRNRYGLEVRSEAMNRLDGQPQGTQTAQTVSKIGFDWSDAGIGAGIAFGVAFLGLGTLFLTRQRKGQLAV